MKYSHVLLVAMIAFSCEKNRNNDGSMSIGDRKIKVITDLVHDPILKAGKFEVSAKLSKDSISNESYFNEKGLLLKQNTYNSKANLESKILFKYDENNNNIESVTYRYDGSLVSKKVNKFNDENKLIESQEFDVYGKVTNKKTTSYDSAGNRILTSYEWKSRGLVKTLESVFDSSENNVANFYFSDDALASREIKHYDVNGDVVETIQYFPLTNEQVATRCKYDKQRNKVEAIVFNNNLAKSRTLFRYDAKNNLTEILSYGVLGSLESHHEYLYEFDAENNWIKRIHVFNEQPSSVLVRRIEYY
jgi:hypothetical protein